MTKYKLKKAIEILREVEKRILRRPDKYDQTTWCGTSCCIAGHIAIVAGAKSVHKDSVTVRFGNKKYAAYSFAMKALGLKWTGVNPWIFAGGFSEKFGPSISPNVGSPQQRAAVGAMAIETFITELENGQHD